MIDRLRIVAAAVALVGCGTSVSLAVEEGKKGQEVRPFVVLDTYGFWRMHHTLKPPVVDLKGNLKSALIGRRWLDGDTAEAPEGWTKSDFDDGGWVRGPALIFCKTPFLSRLCMRGRFMVGDPAKVGDLSLSLDYYGGAIVYVNGNEVARGHVSPGASGPSAMAEAYPEEAYVSSKGAVLDLIRRADEDARRRMASRKRSLADLKIPRRMLRKGSNVLAIEVLRAPFHGIMEQKKVPGRKKVPGYVLPWNPCEIRRVQLAASGGDGLRTSAVRSPGVQVWNSSVLAADFDMDFGEPGESVRPVLLVGARNGTFSGKVVVGSDQPIRGLKATASELKGPAGSSIPASAVRVRYGIAWGRQYVRVPYSRQLPPYRAEPSLLEALAESPLEEFPVRTKELTRSRNTSADGSPAPVFGAVVPVWVTVKVPRDVKAGTYTGAVTVDVKGHERTVPLRLKVVDWTLPDPQDYRTWVEVVQSPDTLTVEYGLDLWSDRHFEMIARSFDYLSGLGSRVVYVPLICQTNFGNEQSMVRWIPRGEGKYDYDFSIMDRYVDLAEKHLGRPKIVVFNIWDIYMLKKEQIKSDHLWLKEAGEARKALRGKGPMVSVLDTATGKVHTEHLPPLDDEASRAMWQPLMAKIRERMRKRGLEDTVMLGMVSDARATKGEIQALAEIAPGVPWVSHGHGMIPGWQKYLLHGIARVRYQATVWSTGFGDDGSKERSYGWKRDELVVDYERGNRNAYPATFWRQVGEFNILGRQRGIGRIGAEFWGVAKDKRGRRTMPVWARYVHSSWRNLDILTALLAPGPDGPLATERLEVFREGIQECEARIFIERALTDAALTEKLGPAMVSRCQSVLDERAMAMYRGLSDLWLARPGRGKYATGWRTTIGVAGHWWFMGSGWQERSERLFSLAGEVERKLGRK